MPGVTVLKSPDVLVSASVDVGEGPVIDARTGRLCWVDITAGVLHESNLTTGEQRSAQYETMLGAAVPRMSAGGLAVAVSDGFGFAMDGQLDVADRVLPEPHRRMNDAKCDSAGRMWAGSTHKEFAPGAGMPHRWAPERADRNER